MSRTTGAYATKRPPSEGRARCWRAMRVLRTFTLPQLCMTADVHQNNAHHYVRALERAGFIRKSTPNVSGKPGSFATWRLVRDSGPDAPIHRADHSVFDPNTQKTYGGESARTA